MKGALIGGAAAAILNVAINVVSDNLNNPWAWLIFFVSVFASALVGDFVEKKVSQHSSVIGRENETEQDIEGNGSQRIDAIGKSNKIKQNIKK